MDDGEFAGDDGVETLLEQHTTLIVRRNVSELHKSYDALVKARLVPTHDDHLDDLANKRYSKPMYALFKQDKNLKSTLCTDVEEYVRAELSGLEYAAPDPVRTLVDTSLTLIRKTVNIYDVQIVDDELVTNNDLIVTKALCSPKDIRECWVELMMRLARSSRSILHLVLPVHNRVITIKTDFSFVDLLSEMNVAYHPVNVAYRVMLYKMHSIGSHVALSDLFTAERPVMQVFLRNPMSGSQASFDLEAVRKVTSRTPTFIHTIYTSNPCNPEFESKWKIVAEDLKQGVKANMSAVVLHSGHIPKGKTELEALATQEKCVRYLLQFATKDCKLALETPCGEANEVCTTVESMNEFFKRFSEEEREKLAIVPDSCHIYAAGYDPKVYVEMWNAVGVVPISLVHFNDSVHCKCSGKDKHARAGEGLIGYERMHQLAQLCTDLQLPMVVE